MLLPLLYVATIQLSSCQKLSDYVKEDRHPCPAWVTITSDPGVDTKTWTYTHLYLPHEEENHLEERKIRSDEFNGGQVIEWEKNAPFAAVGLAGWSGEINGLVRTESSIENGKILVPKGKECPKAVGGAVSTTLTDDELYSYNMKMRDLYASIRFVFSGEYPAGSEVMPEVAGAVCGYSIPDFSLIEGEFICTPHREGENKMEARIPRQEERMGFSALPKLTVTFYYRGNSTEKWTKLNSVSLGQVLNRYKYDWNPDTLEPITVKAVRNGKKVSKVEVSSGDWSTAFFVS